MKSIFVNTNTLIELRQAVYTRGVQKRCDALFNLLDALVSGRNPAAFAYFNSHFQCQWPSLYIAVEDGPIDRVALRQMLVKQLPQGICVFSPDSYF